MEIKIDASEYNKLIVENDKLKAELERVNLAFSRTSDALKRFRKDEEELLNKITALVFSNKEDNREAVMSLRMLMVESGYCIYCGEFDCDGCR